VTDFQPNLITPVGTQIVTKVDIKSTKGEVLFARGMVGVVVKSPVDNTHAYRVRFMDGTEAPLKRGEFAVRKHFTDPQEPDDWLDEFNLYNFVIYRCVVGSRAYGLDAESSDIDRRGIYLPPANLHWSLYGVPEQLENEEAQEAYWELQKFITLALKANPNVLECLYTPLIEHVTPMAQELIDQREIFLSKLIYQTYNGYVFSQFKKMQRHLQNHGTIKWKHAMHLIRLLLSGVTALREGYIPVRVEEHREKLLAIRREQVPWKEVNEWRNALHKEFDEAFQKTTLPDRPDYERANAFLVKARRSMVK
jgi:predicted nucleotidyltransferase